MQILSIDSATKAMGIAVVAEDKLIASAGLNVGKTHSQRLLPLLDDLLREAGVALETIDLLAVTVGPGSFTGLRIGIATAKAIAFALGIKVVPIRTLDALAYNAKGYGGLICPILDARKNEVYYGIYDSNCQELEPIGAKEPIVLAQYLEEKVGLSQTKDVLLLGDGADIYFPAMREVLGRQVKLAPPAIRYFMAASAGFLALEKTEEAVLPELLQAFYLRMSEAETRRLESEKEKVNNKK